MDWHLSLVAMFTTILALMAIGMPVAVAFLSTLR